MISQSSRELKGLQREPKGLQGLWTILSLGFVGTRLCSCASAAVAVTAIVYLVVRRAACSMHASRKSAASSS
jgi:hypothetical protein